VLVRHAREVLNQQIKRSATKSGQDGPFQVPRGVERGEVSLMENKLPLVARSRCNSSFAARNTPASDVHLTTRSSQCLRSSKPNATGASGDESDFVLEAALR
jgi:hypothetical protein